MKITVLFFGILKDIVNSNAIELKIKQETTVKALKKQLLENFINLANYSNFSVAVNEEYATADCILKNNDVVALIPPVSGG